MKICTLSMLFLSLLARPAFSESAVLANTNPPSGGQVFREDTTIRLLDGKFSLGLGEKSMAGSANAFLHDNVERSCPTPDSQKVEVLDSSRNILLSFGAKNAEPKDQPGQLAGKKLFGRKLNHRWTFELADKRKPTTDEAKALHQFAGYTEFSEVFAQLYGTEPRNVGDSWKPDLSSLKKSAPDLDASLTCKLLEITEHKGARCAHVSITGDIAGKIGSNAKVDIKIDGTVYRDLKDLIDADMELNGTFKYTGAFGNNANGGTSAVINAPLKLTRTVKPVRP